METQDGPSDIEKLDQLTYKIMVRYSDELTGLKRKNSLLALAQKFQSYEKDCIRLATTTPKKSAGDMDGERN